MSQRPSRNTSTVSSRSAHIPQPKGLILPGVPVGEQAPEILHDIVHPHEQTEHTLGDQDGSSHLDLEDKEHDEEVAKWKALPWWKRPSPYWLIFGSPLSSIGAAAVVAPRVEMYTILACRVYAPEYEPNNIYLVQPLSMLSMNTTGNEDWFTPDVPSIAHESAQPVSLYIPASPSPSKQNSPDRNKCASDPVVQATVAQLSAVLITTMGVLSCLTTAWWGSLSDRFGRIPVLGISTLGLLANDLTFIVTASFVDYLPGGYWFLIFGFALEGVLGGMSTAVASSHGYLADSTHHSERSRIFSLSLGTTFGGVALGPVIGGVLIWATGSALSPSYLAATAHTLYAMYIFLIIPESQTKARARGARQRRQVSLERRYNGLSRVRVILKSTTSFLSPLAVLLPERVIVGGNPLKRSKRDWSLCFITASYGITMSLMGLLTYMLQYAAGTFKWSPETISYFVASIGAARALFLAVILPVITNLLKPAPLQLPNNPDEPLLNLPSSSDPTKQSTANTPSPSHSSKLDLNTARVSLVVEIIAFLVLLLASNGLLFACGTVIQALGAGYAPAVQAFALEVYNRRGGKSEAGKLFGAISVVQALGSQILGPALYGFVYYKTVAIYPGAIFFMGAVLMMVSLGLLALVRSPTTGEDDAEGARLNDETQAPEIQILMTNEALVHIDDDEEPRRDDHTT
ncbi:MFS general substrate transporter [Rhizopogon vinicolor AM-OR11-026]|uniref:MFS general substrate transporter n=1 Tax=Rhizopogon vinicolor AM-OR11-026 TaxID=1314800 RepID=A0A1B7MX76_9AGAM|nr:MFS general substrate transporter [Rhizopogon vinicolor AM-OR11-026]